MLNKLITGLRDTKGNQIRIGSKLKIPVTCNKNLHGEYAIYEVKQIGMIPFLNYVESEKGKVLREGTLACLLTDFYSAKEITSCVCLDDIRPEEDLELYNFT